MDPAQKTLAAEMLGAQLRSLRERRGASTQEVATEVRNSEHSVVSWERGRRIPPLDIAENLDTFLDGRGMVLAAIRKLHDNPRFPQLFGKYAEQEGTAVSLCSYNTMSIPGLLQTEDYAWAVINAYVPPRDEESIDKLVTKRIERQALLTRRPQPVVSFVIEESALRRIVGTREVMREALKKVIECAGMRSVSVQVMPQQFEDESRRDDHCGLDGPMITIRTEDGRDLGYVEGQAGGVWVADPGKVAVLAQRHGIIRTQALRVAESIALIEQIAGEL